MSQAAVELVGLGKSFGDVTAVDEVDLTIHHGEFFSMLGPSGSGKTTLLRMIAGFEEPTRGRILLAGVDATGQPPFARDVNTVFQDYALFPHMDVRSNVEYGLRVKKVPRAERRQRAMEALESVQLAALADRRPTQLSGGQQQRIALARALASRPKVLLLDESLSALDLKLRKEMQIELKRLQHETGITFIFVTHDQEEALTMSDRIAVFHQGRIEQVASPADLYEHPASSFVADSSVRPTWSTATRRERCSGATAASASARRSCTSRTTYVRGTAPRRAWSLTSSTSARSTTSWSNWMPGRSSPS